MKRILNLLLVLLMFITTAPLQTVEAAASSQTEVFYGYKTASYNINSAQSGKKDTSYNDGYYRDAYKYNYLTSKIYNYDNNYIQNILGIHDGNAVWWRDTNSHTVNIGYQGYYILDMSMDIDTCYSDWTSYYQPRVLLYDGNEFLYEIQEESSNIQKNGYKSWANENGGKGHYIKNGLKIVIDAPKGGRNITGTGGLNSISLISEYRTNSGWVWGTDQISNGSDFKTIAEGYVNPTWSSPAGWRSTYAWSDIKRGSTGRANQDRKGVSFTVTYDPNGADQGTVYKQTGTGNLANNGYTKTGYTFDGWWTESSGGTKVTKITDLNPTEGGSKTVYAHWKANIYTIEYNYNHPSDGNKTTTQGPLTYDQSYTLNSSGLAKDTDLYWFKGWNTNANGTGTTYCGQYDTSGNACINEGATVKNLTAVNGGVVKLYGKWQIKNFYIKFDGNADTVGGNVAGSTPSQTVLFSYDVNHSIALNTSGFSKEGYVQIGWTTKKGGKTVEYNMWTKNSGGTTKIDSHGTNTIQSQTSYFKNWSNGQNNGKTNSLVQPGATITLYAVWAKKVYEYDLDCLTKSDGTLIIKDNYNNTSLADESSKNQNGWKLDDSGSKVYINEDNTKYTEKQYTYCHYAPNKACTNMCIADNDYTYIITWKSLDGTNDASNYKADYGTNKNCN